MENSRHKNTSQKASVILTALAGIFGQLALSVYYSGALVPGQLISANLTTQQLMENITLNRTAIFWDAYLQAIGTLLSVIYFMRLVYLSGSGRRFAGWMVIITTSVMLAIALTDVTFTVSAVTTAMAGHMETMHLSVDFITGATEAFDYTFLFVPAPLLIFSLAIVLLKSELLPGIFGYIAIGIGIAFVVVGVGSLFKTLNGSLGIAFEIVQLVQVVWVIASAVSLLSYGQKRLNLQG
jgi:hypothetical protein